MLARTRGRVWSVTTRHVRPPPGLVVSALAHENDIRYRVVADTRPAEDALPLEPTLEVGYLALTGPAATMAG
jgi:hypothetical protein